MSSWSCPHDLDGVCMRVQGARCDPGMRGCVLHGRYVFARDDTNIPRKPVRAETNKGNTAKAPAPRRRLPF